MCYGDVVVELKALSRLTTIEEAQDINYLFVSSLRRGILLNFGTSSLQFKGFVGRAAPFQSEQSVKSVAPVGRAP